MGTQALQADQSGSGNTGVGLLALFSNVTGNANAAIGNEALAFSTSGSFNTASGNWAMRYNGSGNNNTATGFAALSNNGAGSYNTGTGVNTLLSNSSGNYNMAAGTNALYSNNIGNDNVAVGSSAMYSNVSGTDNTAIGYQALGTNQGGSNNIAVGVNAGYFLRGSRYNIDIGNAGAATDSGSIRLGTPGQQTATYVAGINGARVTGSAVYISSTGQLGVLASSERYKIAVAPMGPSTEKLHQLRPVTFKLKTDPRGVRQYGLIAEEVAKVYPELVIRSGSGRIEGIRYEELAPMLLNEVQQQAAELRDLKREVAELKASRVTQP
ncbi:MAG: tail fiber domain-containing protein [Terriglobales bacterium]